MQYMLFIFKSISRLLNFTQFSSIILDSFHNCFKAFKIIRFYKSSKYITWLNNILIIFGLRGKKKKKVLVSSTADCMDFHSCERKSPAQIDQPIRLRILQLHLQASEKQNYEQKSVLHNFNDNCQYLWSIIIDGPNISCIRIFIYNFMFFSNCLPFFSL